MLKATDPLGRSDGAHGTSPRGLFGRGSTSPLTTVSKASASAATANTPPAPQPVAVPPAPTSTAKPEGAAGNRLLVGPDVKLKGAEILDCDTLVVEGRVEATMDSHLIRIAEQGIFNGKVSIDTAEVHGCFEGELTARGQLIVHATGRVTGKIRYGKILIEEGGQICGDVQAIGNESHPLSGKAELRGIESAAHV